MSEGENPEEPKPKARKKRKGKGKKRVTNLSSVKPTDANNSPRARPREGRPDPIEKLQRDARKAALLEHLAATGDEINPAAVALGIGRTTLWEWRKADADFDTALAEAYRVGTEALVKVAKTRAVDGWEEPVFWQGQIVGHITKYDHQLLQFVIKKRDPTFRDPKWAVPVTAPPTSAGQVSIDLDNLSADEAKALRKIAER